MIESRKKKATFLGRELEVGFAWRTLDKILDDLNKEAKKKDVSMNTLLNQIVYDYFKNKK